MHYPPGKEMKASPCHCVVSSRLMGAVARDLHSVGGLSVCSVCVLRDRIWEYVCMSVRWNTF